MLAKSKLLKKETEINKALREMTEPLPLAVCMTFGKIKTVFSLVFKKAQL